MFKTFADMITTLSPTTLSTSTKIMFGVIFVVFIIGGSITSIIMVLHKKKTKKI